jgi:hypothetical protein
MVHLWFAACGLLAVIALTARRPATVPVAAALALVGMTLSVSRAAADTSWLDLPSTPPAWNVPGQPVPAAPPPANPADAATDVTEVDRLCQTHLRAPQTDADQQVAAAGWSLYGGYQQGWGLSIVRGVTDLDLQCRPQVYQDFVFLDGTYAGTVSPDLMTTAANGAVEAVTLTGPDQVSAVFRRVEQIGPDFWWARVAVDLTISQTDRGAALVPAGTPVDLGSFQPPETTVPPAALATDGAGAWLAQPFTMWNEPGGTIPAAPPSANSVPATCAGTLRPPATAEEGQVVAAGWSLTSGAQYGWGTSVVRGGAGIDDGCRPQVYQDFVFLDGTYAGTVSPQPMARRADGAAEAVSITAPGDLMAIFERYTPSDDPCCPSALLTLEYQAPVTADGPVVVPVGTPALLDAPDAPTP